MFRKGVRRKGNGAKRRCKVLEAYLLDKQLDSAKQSSFSFRVSTFHFPFVRPPFLAFAPARFREPT